MNRPSVLSIKELAIEERKPPEMEGAKIIESYAAQKQEEEKENGPVDSAAGKVEIAAPPAGFFGRIAARISSLFKK